MNYHVQFILGEEQRSETFKAVDPPAAFAMCSEKYPTAKVLPMELVGRFGFMIRYDPPPVQRPPLRVRMGPHKPKKDDPDGTFPFWQEMSPSRRVKKARK